MSDEIKKRWRSDKALMRALIEMGAVNGDLYRRYLINPVIYGLLASSDCKTSPAPIYEALAKWTDAYCPNLKPEDPVPNDPPSDVWYDSFAAMTVRVKSILDLGCGEAYRGRWLSKARVKYVGVDISRALLAKAFAEKKFECVEKDLDTPNPLAGVWKDAVPPEFVMAITLLDQLEHPEWLLADIASLYGARDTGFLLAVTCNPEFYGYAGDSNHPLPVRIATINGDNGGVAYLRPRHSIRKLFRDAGLNIIDEASPYLPRQLANQRTFDASGLDLAHPPLIFWLVEMHGTNREQVTRAQLETWRTELPSDGAGLEGVRLLLDRLIPEAEKLNWRRFQKNQIVVQRHNVGGRLFVVRDGTFESEARNVGAELTDAALRRRWKFRKNDVFGELEIEHDSKFRDRRYFASVVATHEGPNGHAEVLEVPAGVTRDLMKSSALLGNPFFNMLGRKVLDGLIRYDSITVPDSATDKKKINKAIEPHHALDDERKHLTTQHIVVVASLLLQCLEFDRDRGVIRDSTPKLVVIANLRGALSEVLGKVIDDSNFYNRAFRFLVGSGLVRGIRPVNSDGNAGEASSAGVQRGIFPAALKAKIVAEPWAKGNSEGERHAFRRLMSQSAGYVVIDDELALRRCVLEPNLALLKELARRRRTFFPQPADVEMARDADLANAILDGLKARFTTEHWRIDSFGMPIDNSVSATE